MGLIVEAITTIRNLRSERGVEPARKLQVVIPQSELLRGEAYLLEGLANVEVQPSGSQAPADAVRLLIGSNVELLVSGLFDLEAERARLQAERAEAAQEVERAERQLNQPGFRDRAPQHVVQKAEERLNAAQERLARIELQLRELK
jgi:valyl-tRNA synthetase